MIIAMEYICNVNLKNEKKKSLFKPYNQKYYLKVFTIWILLLCNMHLKSSESQIGLNLFQYVTYDVNYILYTVVRMPMTRMTDDPI